MRKLFLFALLFISTSFLYSQERIAKSNPVLKNDTVGFLNNATGWMLNPEGNWDSLPNTIPVWISAEYKKLITYEKRGLGTDNFKYYKLKRIVYNDSTYVILIKKYRDGYYEYMTIEEGWNQKYSFLIYVFRQEEFNKLNLIKDNQINLISLNLIDCFNLFYSTDEEALKLIPQKINWVNTNAPRLILHIAPYKEKNIVQFQIYSSITPYNIIGGIIQEYKSYDKESLTGSKKVYYSNDLFKHCYYETTFDSFVKLFTLNF